MDAAFAKDRLGVLEQRVKRLEEWTKVPAEVISITPPVVARSVVVLPPPMPAVVEVEQIEEEEGKDMPHEAQARDLVPEKTWADSPCYEKSQTPISYRAVPERPKAIARGGAMEQAIGLKWSGWVGAMVLVIGAGLGIKFAYDSGWFSAVPAGMKLTLLSLIGFALIGAGEWVHRRVNRLSAVGLFGAGVALLFVDSYTGFRFYNLYARDTAFVLMGISTLCGAVVAMRAGLVSIAVLALLGGHLAPVLLAGPTPNPVTFFVYLIALQCVGLALAWWGGEAKWWTLRGLVLGANAVWVAALSATPAEPIFLLVSAAMFQFELIASTRTLGDSARSPGAMFSTLVTGGLTAGLLATLTGASDAERAMWVIGLGGACLALGFGLSSRAGWKALRVAYRVQAASLMVVTVPVWFSGVNVEMGWAVVAVAFATLGAARNLRLARQAAVATWCLAVAHLAARGDSAMSAVSLLGVRLPARAVAAGGLALIAQVIGCLCGSRSRDGRPLAGAASVLGSVLFVIASLAGLPPLGATFAIAAYAWLLLVEDRFEPTTRAAVQAVTLVALATVKWAVVDLLGERLSSSWSAAQYAAVLNSAMAVGVFLATTITIGGWLRWDRYVELLRGWGAGPAAERRAVVVMAAFIIGLMAFGLTFEVDRVVELGAWSGGAKIWPVGQLKQLMWTMLWSTAGVALLGVARQAEPSVELRRGWVHLVGRLTAALAVKFLLVDLIGYRVGSGAAFVPVIFNVQFVAVLVLARALICTMFLADEKLDQLRPATAIVIVLVLLIGGALEIDRAFQNRVAGGVMTRMNAELAEQVALSIYTAAFAILAVLVGFRKPSRFARYLGLGLFGLTLLKVVLIDMQDAGQGYRVLSFIGLGLLLLGTSVVYGKLSPQLLAREAEPLPEGT